MARKVRNNFRELPKETYEALAKTKNMTSNQAYGYLKRVKVPKVQTLADIRVIAKRKSKQYKIPIKVTRDFSVKNSVKGNYAYEDGIALGYPKPSVRIHPVHQYYSPTYTKDVVEHELDHIKVMKRTKSR